MSDIGKVRIRVPGSVKRGEVVKVRCLVIHPMERVERGKDGKRKRVSAKTGNPID